MVTNKNGRENQYLFTLARMFGTKISSDFHVRFVCSDQCTKKTADKLKENANSLSLKVGGTFRKEVVTAAALGM